MSSQQAKAPHYFVPGPSRWPMMAGISMLITMIGASAWVNGVSWAPYVNILGILMVLVVLSGCFVDLRYTQHMLPVDTRYVQWE